MIVDTSRNMCPLDKKLYNEILQGGTTFNEVLLLKVARDLLDDPDYEFKGAPTEAQIEVLTEGSGSMEVFLNSVLQSNLSVTQKKKKYSNLRQDITRYGGWV